MKGDSARVGRLHKGASEPDAPKRQDQKKIRATRTTAENVSRPKHAPIAPPKRSRKQKKLVAAGNPKPWCFLQGKGGASAPDEPDRTIREGRDRPK